MKSEGGANTKHILADRGHKLRTGALMDDLSPSLLQGQAGTTRPCGKVKGNSLWKEAEGLVGSA